MEGFDPKQQSQGLGDTIAKFTHATGLDVVADKVAKALGAEDCGCNRRREKLNELIPFNLLYNDGMIDLIAPNYQNFIGFQKAIEELCSKKKNFNDLAFLLSIL